MSSAHRESDDLLLNEMSALARLVDGAWHISRQSPDAENQEQLLDEWSALQVEVLAAMGQSSLMEGLKSRFSLSQWQLALLGLCALPQLDPRYQAVYADLHPGSQPVPCLELLMNLISAFPERKRLWISELLNECSLIRWRLIRLPEGDQLSENYLMTAPVWLATDLMQQFMGAGSSEALDSSHACLTRVVEAPHQCPLPSHQPELAEASLVQLPGEEGSGRRTLALSIAEDRPLWQLDGERLLQHSDYRSVFIDCLRFVALNGGELVWPQGMSLLHSKTDLCRLLADWLKMAGHRCWLLEQDNSPWPCVLASLAPVTVKQERPGVEASAAIWKAMAEYYLPDAALEMPSLWAAAAEHYQLQPGIMLQVVLNLRDVIRTGEPLQVQQVYQECVNQTPASLSGLASRASPAYRLEDVIVNEDTQRHLLEITRRFRQRHTLQERRLSSTKGLLALFWGKPGTGKTMVAEALADELKLPLYKANLASISSKWIGETEKHLAALFDDAERHNGLLFFDEADAVFSRRSQVESSHDKNANLGVSYLLQRMEHFHGLLVLATNFKGNLDPAFMRRMHFSVEFTQPNARDRQKIWQHWLDKVSTVDNLDESWLAEHLELSGAQIRNIVQHCASQAIGTDDERIDRERLARAIYRESQKNDNSFLISTRLADWYDLRQSGRSEQGVSL